MKIVINNKVEDYKNKYKGAITNLLYFQAKHLSYQPLSIATENLTNLMTDFIQVLTWEKENIQGKEDVIYDNLRKEITSLMKKANNFNRFLEYKKTREALQTHVYDFILKLEGAGLLHGYGFGNKFGDRFYGDAEKQSLRKGTSWRFDP